MIVITNNKQKKAIGFTLIELLIAIVILGILSAVGLNSFRSSQIKSRDGKRKADLNNIQKALEMYQNDYGFYPSSANGEIKIGESSLGWEDKSEFKDDKGTIYMKELPNDPVNGQKYYYISGGTWYKLYAKLENTNDLCFSNSSSCLSSGFVGTDCGGGFHCNYGVSSANVNP